MSAESLTVESSFEIDPSSVRSVLRTLLPIAKRFAAITKTKADDIAASGLEAFVESDALWAFFADLLQSDSSALPVGAMASRSEITFAAEKVRVPKEEFVEYIPAILALAKALLQLWQTRRGG